MAQPQVIRAIGASLYILLSLQSFMNHAALLYVEQLRRNVRRRTQRRKRSDDELALFLAVQATVPDFGYKYRRFWVDVWSSHWINRILDGILLQQEWFEQIFRLTRNSFETLHGSHSMCHPQVFFIYF
jgi:hypothetical protein